MKRLFCAVMALMLVFMLAGCGGKSNKSTGASNVNSVSDVLEKQMSADESEPDIQADARETETKSVEAAAPQQIDIDLTQMNSTMVYSQVYDMLVEPEAYLGEIVKMDGQFVLYQAYDENGEVVGDQVYYACIIQDATACCSQGLEFVPAGDLVYPNDFPEIGAPVSVIGEFRTYMEGEMQYCHLVNAQMTVG